MGSKKSPAQPAPPDPVATAAAQASQNAETARVNAALNREDQYTPYGSLTYSMINGGKPAGGTAQPGTGSGSMQPVSSQPTQGIWRSEGGNNYRNMNTGAIEQYAQAPGTAGADGTFYGAPAQQQAPAPAQGAAPAGAQEQRWQSTVTLSPEQQRMLDLQNQAGIQYGETANRQMGAVSERLAAPLDFSTLGPAPTMDAAYRDQILSSMLQRQQPMMDRDRMALETQMANQGIAPGSQAWQRGMDDYSRAQTDMRLAMDQRAGDEMARMYGMQTNARDRAMNEMVQQRQIPLNELAAMLSGGQVQGPSFVPSPQVQMQPADIMGATYGSYNAQQNAYNQQMQNQRANTQGLYGLLGAGAQAGAFAFSDRRLKRDVRRVGELPSGLPVYRFRYLWSDDESVGVMADDVRNVAPHAVMRMPNGYDAVNYAEIV
jgi:hypothetical protein